MYEASYVAPLTRKTRLQYPMLDIITQDSLKEGEPANFAIQINNSTLYLAIIFMTLFYTSMALHTIMMRAEKK